MNILSEVSLRRESIVDGCVGGFDEVVVMVWYEFDVLWVSWIVVVVGRKKVVEEEFEQLLMQGGYCQTRHVFLWQQQAAASSL